MDFYKVLPKKAKVVIYAGLGLLGLTLTAVSTAYAAVSVPFPSWLIVSLAVYPVVSSGLGYGAALTNVAPSEGEAAAATGTSVSAESVDKTPVD